MSVTVNMKPLKGDTFQVEIDGEATVAALKAKVAEMKAEFPAATQKLIYSGKILADDSVIKSHDIKPDGFIVVMVTKATPAPAAAPAAAPTPAATPTPAAAPQPAAATGGAAAMAAALGGAAQPQLPQVILDMKNSPRFKELTMVVAQNPRILERMLPALGQQWPQLLSAIQDNMEGFVRWLVQEAASQAMLAQLANNPNVPPELQQAIQQNPAAVAALLQRAGAGGLGGLGGGAGGGGEGGAPGGAPGGGRPVPVQISPEDEAAIGRLTEMGFERNMAAQAYFACEKNEELAANFLLSGAGDDDMQA